MAAKRTVYYRLKPGEKCPVGQPRRYKNGHGYVFLRWKVGERSYVECYEHRFVMGNPIGHVHHRNGVKDDNRPKNLEVLSASAHMKHHHHPSFDVGLAASLYRSGRTMMAIESILGIDASCLSRQLRKVGVQTKIGRSRICAPVPEIVALHGRGVRAMAIACAVGVTVSVVRRVIREAGLAPHRSGRPRAA